MGLGKTFTNSIVREIGRNYGKAASNYLLGDKHSTPIRMISGNQDFADKTQEKIDSFKDFMRSLDEALDITKLPVVKFNPVAFLFLLLSVIALDRFYFSPKKFTSYIFTFLCLGTSGVFSIIYLLFLNPKSSDGYWGYRKNNKLQKANNELAKSIKVFTTKQVMSY